MKVLVRSLTTLAQTVGPESIAQFINTDEVIKRLAAAQGIDVLNLVRSMEEVQGERQQQCNNKCRLEQQSLSVDAMKTPMMDPSKNPECWQNNHLNKIYPLNYG